MHAYIRNYVLHGLAASPLVLSTLLDGVTDEQIDARPDPDRFTLREVVAHLADWEPIWTARFQKMVEENNPILVSYDEGQFAIDNDYANCDLAEQLARYKSGRESLVALLKSIPEEAWSRTGTREDVGPMSVFEMASMILGHDGYHARQAIEYRGSVSR